jgi:hypothetical protein
VQAEKANLPSGLVLRSQQQQQLHLLQPVALTYLLQAVVVWDIRVRPVYKSTSVLPEKDYKNVR